PGVSERQSLDAVAATSQRRAAAGDRVDKMVELAAVRLGIPFEKETQWLVSDDPIVSGKGDSALDHVLGPQGALRPERLDALVIAIDRTPAVRDLAQRARLGAQCHHRCVDIACLPDRRVDKYARRGKYFDRLLVQ